MYRKLPAKTQLAKMRKALGRKKSARAGSSPAKRRMKVRGHGDYYVGPDQPRTSDVYSGAAARAGAAIAGEPGRYLGGAAHWLFKKITGAGDYKVSSNALTMGTDPPSFASSGRGTIVTHREMLGDLLTPGAAFNIQSFPINAGIQKSFPWLASVAGSFEQYCVRGMIFEYKSTSASALNSTNTALGAVVFATQYNSVAPAFTSKAQMENHEFCTSAKPNQSFIHPIECARGESPVSCLFTRTGSVPSGADQRLYDLGTLYVATQGQQAASTIGEIWVSYQIELLKPQLLTQAPLSTSLSDHWRNSGSVSGTVPFGTTSVLVAGSCLGSTISSDGKQLILPANSVPYVVNIQYLQLGASTSLTTGILTSTAIGSNLTGVKLWQNGVSAFSSYPDGTTSTTLMYSGFYAVAASTTTTNNFFAFNIFTPVGTLSSIDTIVSTVCPAVVSRYLAKEFIESGPRRLPLMLTEGKSEKKEDDEDEPCIVDDDDEILEMLALYKKMKAAKRAEAAPSVSSGSALVSSSSGALPAATSMLAETPRPKSVSKK